MINWTADVWVILVPSVSCLLTANIVFNSMYGQTDGDS
jgi:hypothetical protein